MTIEMGFGADRTRRSTARTRTRFGEPPSPWVSPRNRRQPKLNRAHTFLLGLVAGAAVANAPDAFGRGAEGRAPASAAAASPIEVAPREPIAPVAAVAPAESEAGSEPTASSTPAPTPADDAPPAGDEARAEPAATGEGDGAPVVLSATEPPGEAGEAEAAAADTEPEVDAAPAEPGVTDGVLRAGQRVVDVLTAAGASPRDAELALAALAGHFDFRRARPGHRYRIRLAARDGGAALPGRRLERFEYLAGKAERYRVERVGDDAFRGERVKLELSREVIEVSGVVESSLWDAFVKAGAAPSLSMAMADAFEYDIDFFHETRRGDRFRLFVETEQHEGQIVRHGRILAAEYVGAEVGTRRLYWFEGKHGAGGWFDDEGKSARRAFLRSPLKYSRISSGFGYRHHPVHGGRHFHGGVDYAAPTGTPVHAVADGTVVFAAYKGANGNLVRLRHSGGLESYYLHLSKIDVRPGQKLRQGAQLGRVGSTGRSTGPHLDFRLKQGGKLLDPTKNVVPRSVQVARADRKAFGGVLARWKTRLDRPALAAAERPTP